MRNPDAGFSIMSDANRPSQLQKLVRDCVDAAMCDPVSEHCPYFRDDFMMLFAVQLVTGQVHSTSCTESHRVLSMQTKN